MPFAPDYTPTEDFSQDEAVNAAGRSTVLTAALDAELADASVSINTLNDNLKLMQRDDGELLDYIVKPRMFDSESRSMIGGGWVPRGAWLPATSYKTRDMVEYNDYAYVCVIEHTSLDDFNDTRPLWIGVSSAADAAELLSQMVVLANETEIFRDQAVSSAASASADAIIVNNSKAEAALSADQAASSAATALSYKNQTEGYKNSAANSATSAATSAASAATSAATFDPAPFQLSAGLPGYFSGFALSNSGTTAINIASGSAKDATNAADITLISTTTKQLQSSGAWSANTGGNGLFTGARAANTWYHVFAIKSAGGLVDAGFDTSVIAANRPAAYQFYRRIGSIKTDASGNIIPFLNDGDMFSWVTPVYDIIQATISSDTQFTINTPAGVRVDAQLSFTTTGIASFGARDIKAPPNTPDPIFWARCNTTAVNAGNGWCISDNSKVLVFGARQFWLSTLGWREVNR